MTGRNLHRASTVALSLAMAAVGVALVVEGLVLHGGSVVRVLLGVLFVAAGSGRLYLLVRRSRGA